MAKNGKLELTWVGKDQRPRLEPRLLLEDMSKSYGDPKSPNMLIRGDNLLALKALELEFTDSIHCIYIDPPFNTGQAMADCTGGDGGLRVVCHFESRHRNSTKNLGRWAAASTAGLSGFFPVHIVK